MYGARLMLVFERTSPIVAMSAVSDLVNGWPGGIIQAGRHGAFVTPLYHANRMFAERLGRERLATVVEGHDFGDDPTRPGAMAPAIDAVASRTADGRTIHLKIVNTDPARPVEARIEVRGANIGEAAEWELLSDATGRARNAFAAPDAIAPRLLPLRAGNAFTVRLPARSVSVVTLDVAR